MVPTSHPPYLDETGLLIVPIQNIGSGPALRVETTIKGLNPEGGWSGAFGPPKTTGAMPGIGASGAVSTDLEIDAGKLGDVPGFELVLRYDDVAAKPWRTLVRWVPVPRRSRAWTSRRLGERAVAGGCELAAPAHLCENERNGAQ